MYRDSNLLYQSLEESAASHNSFYRSNDITDDWNNGNVSKWIASGKFTNIFPGCYIRKTKTIDGVTYTDHIDIVVECDPYYGTWDGIDGFTKVHHIGIMPFDQFPTFSAKSDYDLSGGIISTDLYKSILPKYLKCYSDAYSSDSLLSFGTLLSSSANEHAVARRWISTKITIPSEVQIYGTTIFGGYYDCGEASAQLAAFRLNHELRGWNGNAAWLRDIGQNASISVAGGYCNDDGWGPLAVAGFRPILLLH